jgi:hypothetical protein
MMLRAAARRIPLQSLAAGSAPRWGWLLFLLVLVIGTVSVIQWLSVDRIEKRTDEIDKHLARMYTTISEGPYRLRAAQLGLKEPMTVKVVEFRPRKTFEWWGPRSRIFFTITEVRDKTLRIRIAGYADRNPFEPVDAVLPIAPGVAMSLRPAVNISGIPDLHVVILDPMPNSAYARVAVGPKADQPSWGRLRRE